MRRRSSGEVAGKESHDKHFPLLREDRINGGIAWLTFYVNTLARSVFQEQPETMNRRYDKKKHVQSLGCNTMFLLFSDQQERMY